MTMDDGDGNGPQPFASATYTTAGQLFQLSYGGTTETRTYNNLLQPTNQSVPGYLNMTYTYASGQNNGRTIGSVDGITGENTTYSYDALNRLTGASNSQWSETYTYDGFGNLTSKLGTGGAPNAAPSMTASYDANNHQAGSNFDGNGNSGGTRYFENRMVMQGAYPLYATWFYGYDPWGKRVMTGYDEDPDSLGAGSDPINTYNFYGVAGRKLATVSCNGYQSNGMPYCGMGASGQNVYFGSKLIVSGGVAVFTDRLGSVRANTQGEQFAYYPYGEERTNRPDGRDKFGTYFRDAVGQDYADQRYYGSGTGRFWSVDPGGIKTANAAQPASWNRYAYVSGDPVNRFDPHGRYAAIADCGSGWMTDASLEGPCDDGGGGGCYGDGLGFAEQPDPGCPTGGDQPPPPPPPPAPTCEDLLVDVVNGFLDLHYPSLASYASEMEMVGVYDNIDPRLFAAIAAGENGTATNNPFGLGGNGSARFSSIDTAIQKAGSFLDWLIYTMNEQTVSQLWSGNGWKTDPKNPAKTTQPPAYCYGANAAAVKLCQNTGATISGFMQWMGGNPNSLGFPCDN